MHWTWTRFDELGVRGLYDILALRCRVFILEQGPYLDTDGADLYSWHLQGRDDAGVLQAYLRRVDPGIKYAEPSIGRVITAPEVRGSGLGRTLMREGLARCAAQWPGLGGAHQRAGAAAPLLRRTSVSRPCPTNTSRTTIPHVEMLWRPS